MSKENLSAQYGNGLGRIEFIPRNFSKEALRKIVKTQIESSDNPLIEINYSDGTYISLGAESLETARTMSKRSQSAFIKRISNSIERANRVSVTRGVEEQSYYPKVNPIGNFIKNLEALDEI